MTWTSILGIFFHDLIRVMLGVKSTQFDDNPFNHMVAMEYM